jgi:hypothetical protein
LRQARTATRQAGIAAEQAEIARRRHEEQTKADYQRRITESFSKAVEQLGSDQIEARLGGIYTLERISRESKEDYWTVMETLSAFIRERAHWKGPDAIPPEIVGRPAADIAAALTVIARRDEKYRECEKNQGWLLDFSESDMRRAVFQEAAQLEQAELWNAHLERASLFRAHLKGAKLGDAHLGGAVLIEAHLEGAVLIEAHLEGAVLIRAHLEGALLSKAHLERANFFQAHLEQSDLSQAHLDGAYLIEAHLEGACLLGAIGLSQDQLETTTGDAATQLPDGLSPPADWPSAERAAKV